MRAPLLRASPSRVTLSRLKNNNLDMPSATLWLLDGSRVPRKDIAVSGNSLVRAKSVAAVVLNGGSNQFLFGRSLLRFVV